MRKQLVEVAQTAILDEGYESVCVGGMHGCFDIAARKDRPLFVKVLKNIDALTETQAKRLLGLAFFTNATRFLWEIL